MLRLHRSSIQTLQREIVRAYYGQVERDSFYEKMLQDIVSLIFQVFEVDGLYEAIQILNTGHLPHQIINHEQFKRSLNELQVQIREHHPHLVLVKPDVKYYYEQVRPKIFRFDRHLTIILDAPLLDAPLLDALGLLAKPLQIYYIDKIPLLNPHNEDHYTTLMTDFNVIAFHPDIDYILAADGVHQLPEYLDLRQSTEGSAFLSSCFVTGRPSKYQTVVRLPYSSRSFT